MSDPQPPDSDGMRPALPPFPSPFQSHSLPSDLPRFIPVARPASWADVPYESTARANNWPPVLRARRAFFEMLALIPMGFAGILTFYFAAWMLGVRDDRWANVASTAGMGVAASLTAALFVWADRQTAASIGWTSRAFLSQVVVGVLTLIGTYAFFMALMMIVMVLFPGLEKEQPTAEQAVREMMPDMSLRSMFLMMLFVGVWEEVVFRGFLLTRLHALFRRWWLAVPISALVFGSVHIYEGPLAVVMVTMLGVVLAVVFIRRRSLVPCIVMHFLHNSLMLYIMHYHLLDPAVTG